MTSAQNMAMENRITQLDNEFTLLDSKVSEISSMVNT
jgi:hypothetical protein